MRAIRRTSEASKGRGDELRTVKKMTTTNPVYGSGQHSHEVPARVGLVVAVNRMSMRVRIESEIESTEIQTTIVETLHAEAAKPITTRLAAKVTSALLKAHGATDDYEIHLTRYYGMTNLEWGGHFRTQGNRGGAILLSHDTKSAPIAQRYLDDMTRYLAAKHERNAQRKALLASDAPEQIDAALAMVRKGNEILTAIHDADSNYSVLPSAHTLIEEAIA